MEKTMQRLHLKELNLIKFILPYNHIYNGIVHIYLIANNYNETINCSIVTIVINLKLLFININFTHFQG